MPAPELSISKKLIFKDLKLHTETVEECTDMFKRAVKCYTHNGCGKECKEYEQ